MYREEIKFRDVEKYDFSKATFINYENKYRILLLLLLCYFTVICKIQFIFKKYIYLSIDFAFYKSPIFLIIFYK